MPVPAAAPPWASVVSMSTSAGSTCDAMAAVLTPAGALLEPDPAPVPVPAQARPRSEARRALGGTGAEQRRCPTRWLDGVLHRCAHHT